MLDDRYSVMGTGYWVMGIGVYRKLEMAQAQGTRRKANSTYSEGKFHRPFAALIKGAKYAEIFYSFAFYLMP